ncbi:MAG: peptidase M24 [Deltaproteobacteria bacterium]|nr:MAG: peptidase M24 [Deltaproteobacteria bacterium]
MKYTIWVFKKDLKVLRFSLKRPFFILMVSVIVVALFALFAFPFLAWNYWKKYRELKAVKAELEHRTQVYGERFEQLSKQLAALREFERRLRIMANLNPPKETGEGMVAVGGSGGEGGLGMELLDERVIEALMRDVRFRLEGFREIQEALKKKLDRLRHTPSIWPARGWVSCGYGPRINPFTGKREFHTGIDISNYPGTPIVAPADGRIKRIWRDRLLGLALKIDHGYGIETIYGHLQKVLVKVGQRVKRGDKIALMGNTGRSTGPHLHYEVRIRGKPQDPRNYILD